MRAVGLLYHDVVDPGAYSSSGFAGGDADIYKLDRPAFAAHLDAIAAAATGPVASVLTVDGTSAKPPVLMTFDDGGVGAVEHTADMLEERGWLGHFFITTERIGTAGFLSREQIRELHDRGHVIGSHSVSHPPRMAALSRDELLREWGRSVAELSDLLGEAVTTGSVPGGYHSRTVAETAAEAGIERLFHSEPTDRVTSEVKGLLEFGRYNVQRATSPETAGELARNSFSLRARQALLWNAKKVAKKVGGKYWLAARKRILDR